MTDTPASIDLSIFERLIPINALRQDNLERLRSRSSVRTLDEGDVLFEQNSRDPDSFYIIEGKVELSTASGNVTIIQGGTAEALHRISHQIPRTQTATAVTPVQYLRVDSSLLDVLLTSDQTGTFEVIELGNEPDAPNEGDWMAAMLQNPLFQRLAPAKLQSMFMKVEPLEVNKGDIVIRQNDAGDFFYIIVRGRAGVFRDMPGRPQPLKVNELQSGASFGEDALLSDAPRNASIIMLEAGSLVRLAKQDFQQLLANAIVQPLKRADAELMVLNGEAKWLDVRMPNEFANDHADGAINIPLFMLRGKLAGLDRNTRYIVSCDGGKRSMVGAFILERAGYKAQFLGSE